MNSDALLSILFYSRDYFFLLEKPLINKIHRILFVCMYTFIFLIFGFSFCRGKKEKHENHFLITWKSYLQIFLNVRYPTHSVVCTILYLVVV